MIKNYLVTPFNSTYNTPPFKSIQTEDYLPTIKAAITMAKKEIDAIVDNAEKPTFENTIEVWRTAR